MDKTAVKSIVLALSLLAAASFSFGPGQAEEKSPPKVREGFNQPLVLSHLSSLKVVVADLDKFSTDHGVTREHLEALLKDELVPTHATICNEDQSCCKQAKEQAKGDKSGKCNPDTMPLVYLKVRSFPEQEAGGAKALFHVNLSLVEKARVARNKQELMVAVWSREATGRVESNMQGEVDNQVKDVMKDFRRDWSLANSADIGHGRKHPVKKPNLNSPGGDDD